MIVSFVSALNFSYPRLLCLESKRSEFKSSFYTFHVCSSRSDRDTPGQPPRCHPRSERTEADQAPERVVQVSLVQHCLPWNHRGVNFAPDCCAAKWLSTKCRGTYNLAYFRTLRSEELTATEIWLCHSQAKFGWIIICSKSQPGSSLYLLARFKLPSF